MDPSTINTILILAQERSSATAPPQTAEAVSPVDDRMPGKMSAPNAAKGT